jgi:uncharacterized membrane protein YkvA (DUF1232 family)
MTDVTDNWETTDPLGEEVLKDRVIEAAKRGPTYVRFAAAMIRDDHVPVKAKAALVLGGSYVVSPIDLIPGLIPVLGQIDDLVVMMAAFGAATRLTPPDVVERHMEAVGLTPANLTRDRETAELAGRWAVRTGYRAARKFAGKSMRFVAHGTQSVATMVARRSPESGVRSPKPDEL